MMTLGYIGLAALLLSIVLTQHVGTPPPRKARKVAKHLRPYDDLRLTNL